MSQERMHSISDQIYSCFMASEQQHDAVVDNLVGGQMVVVLFRCYKSADQIVLGIGAAPLDHVAKVVREVCGGVVGTTETLGALPHIAGTSEGSRPGVKLAMIFHRHSEHRRNHGHGKKKCK